MTKHSKANLSVLSYQDFMSSIHETETETVEPYGCDIESPLPLHMSFTDEAVLSDIDDRPCFVDKSTSFSDDEDGMTFIDYHEYRVEVNSLALPSLPKKTRNEQKTRTARLKKMKRQKSIAKLENLKSVTRHIGQWEQIKHENTPRPTSGKARKKRARKSKKRSKRRIEPVADQQEFPDINIRSPGNESDSVAAGRSQVTRANAY